MTTIRPLLLGLRGYELGVDERKFIQEAPPLGFILFARNIDSVEQTRELCRELHELSGFKQAFIAVDQEGGRVQRVKFGGKLPPAAVLGEWWKVNPVAAREGAYLFGFLLAAQLRDVGANWLMGPLLDVANEATHAIIGNRSFSSDPKVVVELATEYAKGVRAGGCLTCLKHAPGHGRAKEDTHFELPIVDVSREELNVDLAPFKAMAPAEDFLMTAHIRYLALDPELPATYSAKTLRMMREDWNFNGLIMADDVGMKALNGNYVTRVQNSLDAGCDLAITALSVLRHGMAGTVFDEDNFKALGDSSLPPLSKRATDFMAQMSIPDEPSAKNVSAARERLTELWADGPASLGYPLEL